MSAGSLKNMGTVGTAPFVPERGVVVDTGAVGCVDADDRDG